MNHFTANNIPGRTTFCNGREYLFFSGTSYLGMNSNVQFLDLIQDGLSIYGSNYGSSRNSNFRLAVFEQAEDSLAAYAGAESALTTSSGYLAGQLLSQTLLHKGEIIYAPNTHPALWRNQDDANMGDYEKWVEELVQQINDSSEIDCTVICNSLDPLHAIAYDFSWVSQIPDTKTITLIIDDSHGFGVTGLHGSGIYRQIQKKSTLRLIVISSLAKAIGIPGGVILSDEKTNAILRSSPFYIASSPIPPAYLYAFNLASEIYNQARKKLTENINLFSKSISDSPLFQVIPDFPVFYTRENKLPDYLSQRDILISSFPYPTPESELITRVIINSNHQPADIQLLSQHIHEFIKIQRQ